MDVTALQFFIVCPLVFLAGFVDALTVYLFNGKVLLALGLTAGFFSIAGNYAGTCFFARWGTKSVKPLMLVVLIIFFVKICSDMIA